MSYFSKFPITKYTLDDISTVQVVTNITARAIISDEIIENLSLFYPYIIKDGETPEILADKFYNDPQLHWVILHCNNIFDARFEWPLTTPDLVSYVESKYTSKDAIHHYESDDQTIVMGNVFVESASSFSNVYASNIIINNSSDGIGVVVKKINSSNIIVNVSSGGFRTGDNIKLFSNANITANITATHTINCTAVTAMVYEDRLNEDKRDIKILKTQYLEPVIREFESKMGL